jgi:lycopene cyclase domain-containing protein
MQEFYYIGALLFSLGGLLYADYRHKIAFFSATKRSLLPLALAVCFFLAWDITGIVLDVFSTNQAWVTGLHVVTPDLPIEEFLFLTLFCYNTILVWRIVCLRMS